MEVFSLPTKLYFGPDCLSALDTLAGQHVFLVTDRFLRESGLTGRVTDRLRGAVTVFDAVVPDPSLELCARGVLAFRESGADVLLAFGGGSPMDCAKAIRHFSGIRCPLWCIPTTAGTGSEVTGFSILTDPQQGVKHALAEESLLPDAALLDPGFLAGVPAAVTADTGMDVLTHAAEAFVARGSTVFTDTLAERAFLLAWTHLPAAVRGDMAARAVMLEASCMAGIAFNAAGLGVCHAIAHVIGGTHHLPHGRLNAILLPAVLRWHTDTLPAAGRKYARLARACQLSPTGRALSAALHRLTLSLGIPDRLPTGVDAALTARLALLDRCAAADPGTVSEAALRAIVEEVT